MAAANNVEKIDPQQFTPAQGLGAAVPVEIGHGFVQPGDDVAFEPPALPPPARRRGWFLWSTASNLITGAIAVAGLAALVLLDSGAATPPPPPAVAALRPPTVSMTRIDSGAMTESVVVTGTLVPREEILVAAQIDGFAIEEILVDEGDTVQAGQVLARLSRAMIDTAIAQNNAQLARADAAIAQARSSIADAKASQDQAARALARTRTLRRDGIATTDTFDQREAASLSADARLQSANSALTLAEADKTLALAQREELMVRSARTEIKAPAGGVISRRSARIGAVASAAGEPLFRIIRDGSIELEADVPEVTLGRIATGMKAELVTAARPDALPASVRLVSPEVNQTSRLGKVRLAIAKGPGLTIGAFGRARIDIASREGLLVPQSAILYAPEGPTLQIVRDGVVETRQIALGLRTDQQAEVLKGVSAGEWVVTTAGTFVRDGDRVTGVDSAPPPPPPVVAQGK